MGFRKICRFGFFKSVKYFTLFEVEVKMLLKPEPTVSLFLVSGITFNRSGQVALIWTLNVPFLDYE